MNNYFSNLTVQKPEFLRLKEGINQVVRLLRYEILDSFSKYDGSDKDELPLWKNPIPQIAITVVSAEDGKSGGLTHRIQGMGVERFADLSAKDLKLKRKDGKPFYEDVNGFACYIDEDGDLVRKVSEEKTQKCVNIINQIAYAMGIPVGTSLIEGLDEVRENQTKFSVNVVNKEYEGKEQLRLEGFKKLAEVKANAELE